MIRVTRINFNNASWGRMASNAIAGNTGKTINANERNRLDVNWKMRIVWVTLNEGKRMGERYFVPFEALTMIEVEEVESR